MQFQWVGVYLRRLSGVHTGKKVIIRVRRECERERGGGGWRGRRWSGVQEPISPGSGLITRRMTYDNLTPNSSCSQPPPPRSHPVYIVVVYSAHAHAQRLNTNLLHCAPLSTINRDYIYSALGHLTRFTS